MYIYIYIHTQGGSEDMSGRRRGPEHVGSLRTAAPGSAEPRSPAAGKSLFKKGRGCPPPPSRPTASARSSVFWGGARPDTPQAYI